MMQLVAYTVAVVSSLSGDKEIAQHISLPGVPSGLVTIIGISHGGSLIDTGVTHSTRTQRCSSRMRPISSDLRRLWRELHSALP
jgi:hypothetical protein